MCPAITALYTNKRGFTLTELVVALVILMVGMLGLLQSLDLATNVGLRDKIREESVNLGERVMNEMRAKTFDNISVNSNVALKYTYNKYSSVNRIRNARQKYYITRTAQTLATNNGLPVTKQLEVIVNWIYKGTQYENRVVAPVSIIR